MLFVLSEVHTEADLADVIRVEDDCFNNPPSGFWEVLRGPSIEGCIQRSWDHFQKSPNSRWVKAVDPTTGQIVGAAEFVVNETNPYEKPAEKPVALWLEGDERQDIGSQMLDSFFSARRNRMSCPHFLVSLLFVTGSYRGRGAGRMLMRWGLKIADELGLDAFVESTELGYSLYESLGFIKVGYTRLDAHTENPTAEWQAVYDELLPEPTIIPVMHRSAKNNIGDGNS